jgi:hypothetical protein
MTPAIVTSDCTGRCHQGRACTCCPMVTRNGGQQINTEQMRASGAIEGPFRRTHPLTLTWRQKLDRWIRAHIVDDGPSWLD